MALVRNLLLHLKIINMGKYSEGKNSQTVGFSFATNAPLDDRTVVKTKDSLIGKDTWGKAGYLFDGLITAVQETQELYMYIGGKLSAWPSDFLSTTTAATSSASDQIISKYWKKISSSGLENISGVFTFKGVAEAISPDQRIITTYEVATTAVTDEKGAVITPAESLYCVTTAYEFDMDVYYGWGTSLENIRFWTDTTTVNGDTPQYDKGDEEIEVTAYEFNGKLYYPVDSDVTPAAGDPVTPYESVDGETIYINNGDVFDNQQAAGGPKGEATIVNYKSYNFTGKSTPATLEDIQSTAIIASPDNSGHVYQIGENEYASNGTIWVKLGSPVEDWIIL